MKVSSAALRRWSMLVAGWGLVLLGIAGLFLPILQGILFLLVGLVLLSYESRTVRRFLAYLRLRYPGLGQKIRWARFFARRWWMRVRNFWVRP